MHLPITKYRYDTSLCDFKERVHEYEYLLNGSARGKNNNKKKPHHRHGPKSQNAMAVYALLSLITEAISLKPIWILQSFPQSLNNANSSSSMAIWEKKTKHLFLGLQNFTWLPAGGCPNPMKPTPKE